MQAFPASFSFVDLTDIKLRGCKQRAGFSLAFSSAVVCSHFSVNYSHTVSSYLIHSHCMTFAIDFHVLLAETFACE